MRLMYPCFLGVLEKTIKSLHRGCHQGFCSKIVVDVVTPIIANMVRNIRLDLMEPHSPSLGHLIHVHMWNYPVAVTVDNDNLVRGQLWDPIHVIKLDRALRGCQEETINTEALNHGVCTHLRRYSTALTVPREDQFVRGSVLPYVNK